jgi:hypothetical protein
MAPEDVKRIRNEVAADDPTLTPAQIVQGTRTRVHAQLQIEQPVPYPLPPAAPGKSTAEFAARYKGAVKASAGDAALQAIHDEERTHLAERKAAMFATLPPSVGVDFQRARASDPSARLCRDAHHYAQMCHGRSLWEQTDKLVAEAGVTS